MEKPVIIFGAHGMGRAAQEIFNSHDILIYGFLDDNKELHGKEINDILVMGAMDDDGFLKYIGKKCEAFVAIDENTVRKNVVKMLNDRRKVMPINAFHKDSTVSPHAHIGHGNFVNMGARVGVNANVANHCIIQANAVVDFEATLGDFVQVGIGASIGSNAIVENEAFIGAGAVVIAGITVGKGARVGAGSLVIADVPAGATVFGNPAKEME